MSGSAFLHIQDRESGPIRVVELPWISVRIGRAAYCELRLPGEQVPAEACRLQRRGEHWFLLPLASTDQVQVDGQPLKVPHPLPLDSPFRVGPYELVLKSHRALDPSRDVPRPTVTLPDPQAAPRRPAPVEVPRPPEARSDRFGADWNTPLSVPDPVQPRVPSSPRPPAARPVPDNPWEARWKAAAARMRPAASPAPAPAPGPELHASRSYRPPEAAYRGVPLREPQAPEPRAATVAPPTWDAPDWAAVVAPPQPPPRAPAPAPGPRPAVIPEPPPAASPPVAPAPAAEARVMATPCEPPAATIEVGALPEPADEAGPTFGTPVNQPACQDISAWLQYYSEDPVGARAEAVAPEPPAGAVEPELARREPVNLLFVTGDTPAGVSIRHDVLPEFGPLDPGQGSVSLVMSPAVYPEPSAPPRHRPAWADRDEPTDEARAGAGTPGHEAADTPRPAAAAARSGVRTATLLDADGPREGDPRPDPSWAGTGPAWDEDRRDADPDLPSAREILAAATRPSADPGATDRPRAAWERAAPTIAHEPGHWSVPAWLAFPPAALLVLAVGLGGSFLAFLWAADSCDASLVRQRLLASGTTGGGKPLPDGVVPPRPSWWRTTPRHLAEWGVYLGRSPQTEGRAAEPGELLDAAVQAAPLHPLARLARAQQGREADRPDQLALGLGLSRDAASLGWSARLLRRTGKKEAALRVFRRALEVASRADPRGDDEPDFSDDPGVPRYLLPGEPTALPIARELVEDADWAFQDWSPAVPEGTVAALATARLLHERGRPEAQPLLEGIARREPADDAPRGERATHLAMRAEACALLARWKEAEQAYRQAIDEAEDPTTRRSWWFNLANVASQLDDQRQREAALQAALDVSASDDISRRAMKLQRSSEPLSRLRPGGTRAN